MDLPGSLVLCWTESYPSAVWCICPSVENFIPALEEKNSSEFFASDSAQSNRLRTDTAHVK